LAEIKLSPPKGLLVQSQHLKYKMLNNIYMSNQPAPLATGQTWNTAAYAANGRFVATLASGVVDLLSPQPGECILDLGCGDGALTEQLAATGALVTGVDASPSMVAAARQRGLNVELHTADALPYNGQFDAVFSNAALHWIPADNQHASRGAVNILWKRYSY
jgi:trans-aconitate methyltransferase